MERCPLDKIKASRAGIIPYVIKKGKMHILLAIKEGEYTDFGGGCKRRENFIECALREFKEETIGVLHIDKKNLTHILIGNSESPYEIISFVKVRSLKDVPNLFDRARDKILRGGGRTEHEAVEIMGYKKFKNLKDKRFRRVVRSMKKDIEALMSTI